MSLTRQNTIGANRICRVLAALVTFVFLSAAASSAFAQGSATRYVYDDNGRLRAVIAPNGEANVYEYDAAGNITAIRRNTASTLEVLDFSPREGVPGTQVTIIGTGFGGGVNAVAFNGTTAQIVSVNAPQVVVTVPNGATSGPISVTTPGGSANSARSFIVRGISITPLSATVFSQRSLQFTAAVVVTGDQSVSWRVDGIKGGSSTVGTISNTGLYVSPNLPLNQSSAVFRIRATSVADASLFGEAVVTVRNPLANSLAYSPGVSVLNSSAGSGIGYSPSVAVTTGPGISAISPGQAVRGTNTAITISGLNLTGATSFTFLNATDGSVITNITASNINVNGAGTSVTATLTVNAGASLGRRIVIVTAPNGITATQDTGVNVIEIVP